MKKTLIALSLAAALISTNVMAAPKPAPVPKPVAEWLENYSAHVVFHTLAKAQAFAKANGINPDKIQVYVISSKHSAKQEGKKIYLIDNIGIGKSGKPSKR